ncbi:SDR family oxidoreductase [Phanerochaete sordida]|uniref:SDR family oxidoreductase n=1 Tax=Phanerochaete sordida TaxID=48140 RepID=A0A9P3GBM4_9APHY|nr:SDR family oxidoreductase [Phanerochaete sordida]
MVSPRVWLVTGSSSGFGLSICKLALARGDRVVATLRKPSAIAALSAQWGLGALLVLQVDVTRPEEVAHAFAAATAHFGRVDVVFNNAGMSIVGEVEGVPEADARRLMDVNFWGALAVCKAAVRCFREDNPAGAGGLLFNMSSAAGQCCPPATAYYNATKHALEGLSETLAAEVDPTWNIRVCILAPGFFRSPITDNAPTFPVHPAYTSVRSVQHMRDIIAKTGDPTRPLPVGDVDKACRAIFEVSALEHPPLRLFLGTDCTRAMREKCEKLLADLDASATWSESLQEDPLP